MIESEELTSWPGSVFLNGKLGEIENRKKTFGLRNSFPSAYKSRSRGRISGMSRIRNWSRTSNIVGAGAERRLGAGAGV